MTAPVASIGVAVRKAVIDGLAEHFANDSDFNGAAVAEQKTVVKFGYDFSNLHREHVYLGKSRRETPPAGMRSGRNTRQETGRFDLNVMVRVVAGDAYAAQLRAAAIGAEVESWLADRKNNELDVDGLQTLVVETADDDYRKIDNGTAAFTTYSIRYTSRLE